MASMFYGEPRVTMDIDLAVAFDVRQLGLLKTIFSEPAYYCPPDEILIAENARECRGHFNLIHISTGLKADLYPSQYDPFFEQAWQQRREILLSSGPVFYAPPEYVIFWKVAYYAEGGSDKHVRDIRRMMDVSGSEIDQPVLTAELSRRNLLEVFQKITRA